MNRSGIQIFSMLVGLVILFMIARELIVDHAIPSLSEFMASSTDMITSSTTANDIASTISSTTSTIGAPPMIDLETPGGVIHVMLADTDVSREQGLSDRASLSGDAGMLFAFDTPGQYGFWMKNMHFSLDMVWISADKTVTGVTKDISSSTYPSIFMPPGPISYVLEVNAGSADAFGLVRGAVLHFDLLKN
jgi:uncharacterized membrane protein (UPF0127 family)